MGGRTWRQRKRGSAMLEFLIVLPMLMVLTFYPIMTYLMQSERNKLDTVKDKYLQIAQMEGGFTQASWNSLLDELAARGFDSAKLSFSGSSLVGDVRRRGEVIVLNIGYPQGNSQMLLALVGIAPDSPDQLMWVNGSILSERP